MSEKSLTQSAAKTIAISDISKYQYTEANFEIQVRLTEQEKTKLKNNGFDLFNALMERQRQDKDTAIIIKNSTVYELRSSPQNLPDVINEIDVALGKLNKNEETDENEEIIQDDDENHWQQMPRTNINISSKELKSLINLCNAQLDKGTKSELVQGICIELENQFEYYALKGQEYVLVKTSKVSSQYQIEFKSEPNSN